MTVPSEPKVYKFAVLWWKDRLLSEFHKKFVFLSTKIEDDAAEALHPNLPDDWARQSSCIQESFATTLPG